MKNSVIANSINKIAILVLLSVSVVYHVKECFNAKHNKAPLFKQGFSTADYSNAFLPSSSFSYLVSANKNFIKP